MASLTKCRNKFNRISDVRDIEDMWIGYRSSPSRYHPYRPPPLPDWTMHHPLIPVCIPSTLHVPILISIVIKLFPISIQHHHHNKSSSASSTHMSSFPQCFSQPTWIVFIRFICMPTRANSNQPRVPLVSALCKWTTSSRFLSITTNTTRRPLAPSPIPAFVLTLS